MQNFSSLDTQQQLVRHLLKTLGSEMVSELVLYISQDSSHSVMETKDLTVEARQKLIADLEPNVRAPLLVLHKSVQGCSVEEFLTASDAALVACDVVLRKADKKKDKSLISGQRHLLIDQLNSAVDAALTLHIAVLLIFHTCTQTVLNASGRFVPQIIAYLQPHIPGGLYDSLTTLQGILVF